MIKFPTMHIRDSVMNGIMNGLDDLEVQYPSVQPPPIVPGASTPALGIAIEEGLQPQPAVQMSSNPIESAVVGETLQGGSPLAGMLMGALG